MKPFLKYLLFVNAVFLLMAGCQKAIPSKTGTVKITFRNMVNTTPMVLGATVYTNPFGETYTLSKFKYYISNVRLGLSGVPTTAIEKESYHLVDQSVPGSLSFSFEAEENSFITLSFLIGVDSVRNVSGAQTGALDPLKDMFWTWNSGYIMAKLEGTSPQSNQVGNKIEYHIGGFSGVNNAVRAFAIALPGGKFVNIKKGKISEIILEADVNKWWQSSSDVKITDMPVCTTPGVLAKKVADNYRNLFRVIDVVNN